MNENKMQAVLYFKKLETVGVCFVEKKILKKSATHFLSIENLDKMSSGWEEGLLAKILFQAIKRPKTEPPHKHFI